MSEGNGERPHESTLGKNYVGLPGVVVIIAYLVLFSLLDFYLVIKVWPPDPLPGQVSVSTGHPPAGTPESSTTEHGPPVWQVDFLWCDNVNPKRACWVSLGTSLFLIAILSGALGGLLHSLRSLYWYVGNRRLIWSWAVMYMLLPFSGAVLATVFYIVIRAGFLPSSGAQGAPNTPYAFAALGALVGLFSEEAVLKLRQVAETVFTRSDTGKDHAAPAHPPKVISIAPTSGPTAGGNSVTITGADFAGGASVHIGGLEVTSIVSLSAVSINAVAPPHPAGPADVEVVNLDGQRSVLAGGYRYV